MALFRRITGTSKILSSSFATPINISCSFASTSKTKPQKKSNNTTSDDPPVIVTGAPQKFQMMNPFQSAGPNNVIEVNEIKNNGGTLVRVTMPGVAEDGFKVWTEKSTVFFMGSGKMEFEEDGCGRKYGGSLEFSPEMYKPDEVKAEMRNGILRLLVPSLEGAEGN